MIKNILSVLIFLFIICFIYVIINIYFSENQETKIKKKREIISQKINDNIGGLAILHNDTDNVIEFNSIFENKNTKIKRNFWKLFKRND
jgi:ABC-type multidrug transport system fused ATPase/permease subunit